jgi:hypothetical protein
MVRILLSAEKLLDFVKIAKEADDEGTFDESFRAILRLLQQAAREGNAARTHLLTVSLHAFLHYKGGNYAARREELTLTRARPKASPGLGAEWGGVPEGDL